MKMKKKTKGEIKDPHAGAAYLIKYSVRLFKPIRHAPEGYFHNMARVVLGDSEHSARGNLINYTEVFDKGVPEIDSVKFLGHAIAKVWDKNYWGKIMT